MVRAKTLGMDTGLCVVLPGDLKTSKASRVLYLLHPLGGDAASWMRWTSAERYAVEHDLAVVCPEVQRSFYIDMARGGRYFTYLTEELPDLAENLFGLQPGRAHTFVAGASMGGYGALKAALTRPDLYGGCAAFSSACDLGMVKTMAIPAPGGLKDMMATLGSDLTVGDENDLSKLAHKAAKGRTKPRILMCCGASDFLIGANIRMHKELDELGFDVRYRQWAGGHTWAFWDQALPLGCAFFGGAEPPEEPYA